MKTPLAVDAHYRSLLHKAARRGYPEWIITTGAMIDSMGKAAAAWLETRSAAIIFAECWPLGAERLFSKGVHSKIAALTALAAAQKNRDATGLGFLAYVLDKGDASALDDSPGEKPLRWLARAIRNPAGFWKWASEKSAGRDRKTLIDNAFRFQEGDRPHDRAVSMAAAYLALTESPPAIQPAPIPQEAFPFWVVYDRHTPEGRRVLKDVARDLHLPLPHLEWAHFYCEGARANAETASAWWQAYCRWHFRKIGLLPEEIHLLWEPAKEQMMAALAEESQRLQNGLYRWKLAHMDVIEAVKRRVELFNAAIVELQKDQSALF
ncbi:MAG: hypothetical protein MUD16_05590 [Desulfobacterales bacterium]|jgi:hypothetical protein|nr:hypothetical protein [Desulfobacterales bacterium]